MQNITSEEFRKIIEDTNIIIIPFGSYEQHSRHMVLSTDSIIAEYIATELSYRLNAVSLPVITYGVSEVHLSFNGTIAISKINYYNYVKDILTSLKKENINLIVMINGHGGNYGALHKLEQELSSSYKIILINWWEIVKYNFFKKEEECSHAGAQEISVLGTISPELIRTNLIENQKHNKFIKGKFSDIRELTLNGVIGIADTYNLSLGRQTIDYVVDYLVKEINLKRRG